MVSSKSRKAKRRNARKRKKKRFESLRNKIEQGPFRGSKILIRPSGQAKMSEVLRDFVEPYSQFASSEENYRKLLTLAVIAWNVSSLPEDKQMDIIDRTFEGAMPEADEELTTVFKEILSTLIVRKNAYFSDCKRTIIHFELTDTGRDYRLSVASTLGETSS